MTLESLALLGEFIGGVAVLITIVYLAYQTRQTRMLMLQSNKQQAASMLRANIDGWNHSFASILANAESVETYQRMRGGDVLEGRELQRAELIGYMLFLNLENLILQNAQTPFVDDVENSLPEIIRHRVMEVLGSPPLLAWWQREKISFSRQFQKTVDDVIANQPSAAS